MTLFLCHARSVCNKDALHMSITHGEIRGMVMLLEVRHAVALLLFQFICVSFIKVDYRMFYCASLCAMKVGSVSSPLCV